jgi:sugar/nucleoside kinase (ribokinase family)
MAILVVGSIALDTIETPEGKAEEILGGSAVYFAYAASFFDRVNLVGVVGEDFPEEHIKLLHSRSIDTEGLQVIKGKTFRWIGSYEGDMNNAKTHSTCLNVFENFQPIIPEKYKNSDVVFLANIDPDLQIGVLSQVVKPKLIVCDTMNLWINTKKKSLTKLLGMVDIAVMNEGEARLYAGTQNLIKAAKHIFDQGPKYVVIKKGENGVLMLSSHGFFAIPGFPVEQVKDPTGAGDTFAGGLVGNLAKSSKVDKASLRKAIIYGCVMASFNVEDFSLERMKRLDNKDISDRYLEFVNLTNFHF